MTEPVPAQLHLADNGVDVLDVHSNRVGMVVRDPRMPGSPWQPQLPADDLYTGYSWHDTPEGAVVALGRELDRRAEYRRELQRRAEQSRQRAQQAHAEREAARADAEAFAAQHPWSDPDVPF